MSTNPVFNFAVSETSAADAWGTMLHETVACTAHRNTNDFDRLCAGWEDGFKAETNAPMPGAYRSAKSVLKNAIKGGIPLLDEEGKPRGKTAIEKDIKAAKDAAKEEKTPEEKAASLATSFVQYCQKHGLDSATYFTAAYNTIMG